MRPYVSCDSAEFFRNMGIALFYFTEGTCEQGGSGDPRAMLIQLGFADIFNVEVGAGLALLLDPPRWAVTLPRPASRAREMQHNPRAACRRSGQSATPPN